MNKPVIQKQKYKFRAYSKEFPKLFAKEKAKLIKILPKSSKIEHVGSTAVPGLGGKGIIDITILTPRKKLKNYMQKLEKLGFEYHPGHPGNDKRIFMQKIRRYKGKERRVHIHLCINREFHESFISFREYLKNHKEAREKYAKIKKEAVRHAKGEGAKYALHKYKVLKEIAEKARAEYKEVRA